MNKPRRYEKVNDHVIRLIIDKIDEIPIAQLIETRRKLVADRDRSNKVIKNIDEILTKAKELGITPEPKDKKVEELIEGSTRNNIKNQKSSKSPVKPPKGQK